MVKVVDGKALAQKHEQTLREKISQLKKTPKVVSILIGDDPTSLIYSKMKSQKAQELGIDFKIEKFETQPSRLPHVSARIKELNEDNSVNGIMIQLPAPNQDELISLIDPKKDIDGLTGKGPFLPATVRGVLSILKSIGVIARNEVTKRSDTKEKIASHSGLAMKVGVVGSEGMVGKGLVSRLQSGIARLIQVDEKLLGTSLNDLKNANVVISCVGKNNLIKPKHIKEGAVLIDVGLGDFDPACYDKASAYTPVKGGVGPMTIVSLMENIVDTAYNT